MVYLRTIVTISVQTYSWTDTACHVYLLESWLWFTKYLRTNKSRCRKIL